jgi:hypothetical protein
MGIPVVETGDRWHVDVAQKVPLNFDRDNLPPATCARSAPSSPTRWKRI